MLFNSYEFLFLFFPLTLLGYYCCRWAEGKVLGGKIKESITGAFLLIASLIFYGWLYPVYLPILICSMAVNYGLNWQMERVIKKKPLLIAGLTLNIGVLAVFKYLTGDFLPLGISFYTFTQIAFLMECYRGNLQKVRILEYGLYVTFFPKLIQGPIVLPGEMLPQFKKTISGINWEAGYRSVCLFVLGLFKKVLIADTLGKAVDYGYANLSVLNAGDGMILMLSYTLQLYFDFSGYCDMAMGIAGLFGMELPLNFDSPYKAGNIIDFWKRWHITLTHFFTKYLYIPLGGNRKGNFRTIVNCLIVFFLSGLWHGAGWQFIIWGMMHGVLYVITRQWLEYRKKRQAAQTVQGTGQPDRSSGKVRLASPGQVLSVFLTFLYVNVAWIFFRASSVKEALSLLKTIGSLRFGRINWDLADCFNLDEFWYVIKVMRLDSWQYSHYILMILILVMVLLLVFFGKNAVNYVKTVKPNVINIVIMAVLFVWSVISLSGVSTFLYVNF